MQVTQLDIPDFHTQDAPCFYLHVDEEEIFWAGYIVQFLFGLPREFSSFAVKHVLQGFF